jgi:hypothetical protein
VRPAVLEQVQGSQRIDANIVLGLASLHVGGQQTGQVDNRLYSLLWEVAKILLASNVQGSVGNAASLKIPNSGAPAARGKNFVSLTQQFVYEVYANKAKCSRDKYHPGLLVLP